MSRLFCFGFAALIAGIILTASLSAQEVPPKPDDKKAAEPTPAKEAFVPPAGIQLDPAKTLRLAKLLENLHVLNELNVGDEAYARLNDVKEQERLESRRSTEELMRESKASRDLSIAERAVSYLAAGMSNAEILDDFPYLTQEDIQACLAFAADGGGHR